ncbi:hypothetical protein ebA4479 [Aromatoleum aromaticum EbN1]|uniref:Uncharacterized protein n=1 Tax=Aromatoleum aromaticum (strain DSM 19018 / LMG 30748 / EbN1) TaxID=76114 RepID=Q5P200_AROAE|nr:hypothetical protein ebA4479 [Aromatoleum aromaticum EbN1]
MREQRQAFHRGQFFCTASIPALPSRRITPIPVNEADRHSREPFLHRNSADIAFFAVARAVFTLPAACCTLPRLH